MRCRGRNAGADPTQIARLLVAEGKLDFQWIENENKDANLLRNCLLKIDGAEKPIALRNPRGEKPHRDKPIVLAIGPSLRASFLSSTSRPQETVNDVFLEVFDREGETMVLLVPTPEEYKHQLRKEYGMAFGSGIHFNVTISRGQEASDNKLNLTMEIKYDKDKSEKAFGVANIEAQLRKERAELAGERKRKISTVSMAKYRI